MNEISPTEMKYNDLLEKQSNLQSMIYRNREDLEQAQITLEANLNELSLVESEISIIKDQVITEIEARNKNSSPE